MPSPYPDYYYYIFFMTNAVSPRILVWDIRTDAQAAYLLITGGGEPRVLSRSADGKKVILSRRATGGGVNVIDAQTLAQSVVPGSPPVPTEGVYPNSDASIVYYQNASNRHNIAVRVSDGVQTLTDSNASAIYNYGTVGPTDAQYISLAVAFTKSGMNTSDLSQNWQSPSNIYDGSIVFPFGFSPDGAEAYTLTANGTLAVIDSATGVLKRRRTGIPTVASLPSIAAVSTDGTKVFIGAPPSGASARYFILDSATLTTTKTVSIPVSGASGVLVNNMVQSQDGAYLYSAATKAVGASESPIIIKYDIAGDTGTVIPLTLSDSATRWFTAVGLPPFSTPIPPLNPLAPPTGLTTPNGAGILSGVCEGLQATLIWQFVTGATSYTLYRDGGRVYTGALTEFVDTNGGAGLVPGQAYSYTVTANNASGPSMPAGPVIVTPCVAGAGCCTWTPQNAAPACNWTGGLIPAGCTWTPTNKPC